MERNEWSQLSYSFLNYTFACCTHLSSTDFEKVTLSLCYFVTLLLCHFVTLLLYGRVHWKITLSTRKAQGCTIVSVSITTLWSLTPITIII